MDSKLDSIFRTTFRPAEKTDTWLGISHHDPDQPNRKKDDGAKDEQPESFDDKAAISVPALHAFLKNLLQQASAPERSKTTSEMPVTEAPPPHPVNRQAASAALAYQNTARHTPGARIDLDDQAASPAAAPSGPSIELGQDDLRAIHRLIDDVQALANRGIGSITIEKADTFLESLSRGVHAALESSGGALP